MSLIIFILSDQKRICLTPVVSKACLLQPFIGVIFKNVKCLLYDNAAHTWIPLINGRIISNHNPIAISGIQALRQKLTQDPAIQLFTNSVNYEMIVRTISSRNRLKGGSSISNIGKGQSSTSTS